MNLSDALSDPKWINHKIGDIYSMDGESGWKIAYYPIFENGKTREIYSEPRALVEKPIVVVKHSKDFQKGITVNGIDFKEVPLRYLTKV